MRRREFIALLGEATASWPFVARAQLSTMPAIGSLGSASPTPFAQMTAAFDRGPHHPRQYIEAGQSRGGCPARHAAFCFPIRCIGPVLSRPPSGLAPTAECFMAPGAT